MNLFNAQKVLILKDSLFILTNYLAVAQRRIKQGGVPLNPTIVQDAQELCGLIRLYVNRLQQSN